MRVSTLFLSLALVARSAAWSSFCRPGLTSRGKSFRKYDVHDREDVLNPNLESCDEKPNTRRSFIRSSTLSLTGAVSLGPLVQRANAMGLVTFPCPEGSLMNKYHLMRSGQSLLEEKNILSTNPLFLTNHDDALTALGVTQVEDACNYMMANGINPSVVKYSLAAKCIDSTNIVATGMMIGRNRIIPEFTFMDPRGAGIWDGGPNEAALWALDHAEAGVEGRNGRPPPNDDGTANETLHEQMIRLRQLMSVLETQYSGDSILLVFPDGSSPALLSALIAGIPLKDTHALNFEPGEVRLDVTMDSTLAILKDKQSSQKYNEMLEVGQNQIETLQKELLLRQEEENAPPKAVSMPLKASKKATTASFETNDGGTDFYAAGAMGAIASMTMLRKERDEESAGGLDATPEPASVLAFANGFTNTTDSSTTPVEVRTYYRGSNVVEEVPVLSKEERRDVADRAMENYLNKDDGGDDWLSSMQDLMNE